MGGFKVSVSTGALGMDGSFRDSLSVEVGELVNEVDVIKGDRAVFPCSHGVLVIVDGSSVGGGECFGHVGLNIMI
jgi:hypothetical protein